MRILRTTALAAALMTAAVSSLATPAQARGWGWRGGWGWGGPALGFAAGALVAGAFAAPYYINIYGDGYGYGYPVYGYGYGYRGYRYGYGYPGYGYGYPAFRGLYGYYR